MAAPYSAVTPGDAVSVTKEALPEISVPSVPPFTSGNANGIQVTVAGDYPQWPTDMEGSVPE